MMNLSILQGFIQKRMVMLLIRWECLQLYNLIGINQKEDSPMNVGAVKELIDAAIAKSQGGIRKFKTKCI